MSDRSMSAAMLSAIANDQQIVVHLLELHFDSGVDYSTDAPFDVSWGGNTYSGIGQLLQFSSVQETTDLLINRVNVTLSGIDTTAGLAAFQAEDYLDRELKIYIAELDADHAAIVDPLLIHHGRMDAPTYTENPDNGTATVGVVSVPVWAETGREPGRHTNHEEQTFFFPATTDLGFEFVSEVPKTLLWGRA